jgi:RNA polymerase sigma-70 factor (family 1)
MGSKTQDNADSVNALVQGDEAVFAEIYKQNWQLMYQTAYRRTGDEEQAKDIVQDIFVRMWDQRESLSIVSISAYLRTAVRYQVYNLIAREKITDNYFKYLSELTDHSKSPDENIHYKELVEKFEVLLDRMPEKRREIFQLRFEDELSTQRIAEKLNITQKTVQNQIIKAVHYLRTALAPVLLYFFPFINK